MWCNQKHFYVSPSTDLLIVICCFSDVPRFLFGNLFASVPDVGQPANAVFMLSSIGVNKSGAVLGGALGM